MCWSSAAGPAGMMAAQTLMKRGHSATLWVKPTGWAAMLIDASAVPFKQLMREYLEWDIKQTMSCGAKICLNTEATARRSPRRTRMWSLWPPAPCT